jgi:hypothetical protein
MALGSPQSLTEMRTRNLLRVGWGGDRARKDDNLTAICEPIVCVAWWIVMKTSEVLAVCDLYLGDGGNIFIVNLSPPPKGPVILKTTNLDYYLLGYNDV